MKNIIIYLIFMAILISPLFHGTKGTDVFIISILAIVLLLLLSGCTHLVLVPMVGPGVILL